MEPAQDCHSRWCTFSSEHGGFCGSCWLTCKHTLVARFSAFHLCLTCYADAVKHAKSKVVHLHMFARAAHRALNEIACRSRPITETMVDGKLDGSLD